MYKSRNNFFLPWLIILTFLLIVIWLFYMLKPILAPFVTAAILAYILSPLVNRLVEKGIHRGIAAMLIMLLTFFIIIILLLIIIPMLISETNSLISKTPVFIQWLSTIAVPKLNQIFHTHYKLDMQLLIDIWQQNDKTIQATLSKLLPVLMEKGGNAVSFIVNLVILPLILYYSLSDWSKWVASFKDLIPRRMIGLTERVMTNLDQVLGEFLRGQLMVMIIMGLFYGLGLSFVGLENGFAIGMLSGLLVFVPYLGAFTGLFLATLATLLQFPNLYNLLLVWSVFGAGQMLESYFLTPYLVGERIGLSPLMVIFALLAFGQLMGFIGMLLALPMAAICLVIYRECLQFYLESRFYQKK